MEVVCWCLGNLPVAIPQKKVTLHFLAPANWQYFLITDKNLWAPLICAGALTDLSLWNCYHEYMVMPYPENNTCSTSSHPYFFFFIIFSFFFSEPGDEWQIDGIYVSFGVTCHCHLSLAFWLFMTPYKNCCTM